MANLPQSLSMNVAFGGPSVSAQSVAAGSQGNKDRKMASAEHLVLELSNPDLRENALLELSKVNTLLPTFRSLQLNDSKILFSFCGLNGKHYGFDCSL